MTEQNLAGYDNDGTYTANCKPWADDFYHDTLAPSSTLVTSKIIYYDGTSTTLDAQSLNLEDYVFSAYYGK